MSRWMRRLSAMGFGVLLALSFAASSGAAELEERALGDPNAPVTIVEYASLTCPHCAAFHQETLPALKRDFIEAGEVRLVYRDFPFDRAGLSAAALAHCSGDRYFAFIEAFFANQSTWARAEDPIAALGQLARLGGMSQEEIDRCLADEELADAILTQRLDAQQNLGIDSTPSFVIGDQILRGAQTIEALAEVIEAAQP